MGATDTSVARGAQASTDTSLTWPVGADADKWPKRPNARPNRHWNVCVDAKVAGPGQKNEWPQSASAPGVSLVPTAVTEQLHARARFAKGTGSKHGPERRGRLLQSPDKGLARKEFRPYNCYSELEECHRNGGARPANKEGTSPPSNKPLEATPPRCALRRASTAR